MSDLVFPFATAYERVYVPKNCRNPRTEYPVLRDHAFVPGIAAADAAKAFTIHYPIAPEFYAFRRADEIQQRHVPVDILSYRNAIWWPLGSSLYAADPLVRGLREGFHVSAGDWLERIRKSNDLLGIRPPWHPRIDNPTEAREETRNGSEEAIAPRICSSAEDECSSVAVFRFTWN